MKISKTRFFDYIRCHRYVALEESVYQRDKAVISFDESLEDLYTEELKSKKQELLNSLYEQFNFDESDFDEDADFDPLSTSDQETLFQYLQPQYEQIEQMSAVKVKSLFGGNVIFDKDTFKQKYVETEMDGFTFFAFLDAFQEDDQAMRIIETKASTSNKFFNIGYKVSGEHISVFHEQEHGIFKLKHELNIEVDDKKYNQQLEHLMDKYHGAGKYVYDLAYQRFILEHFNQSRKHKSYYLAVLNHNYIHDGQIDGNGDPLYDPLKMIVLIDLTEITGKLQPIIKDELNQIIFRLNHMQAQPVPLGKHCQKDKPNKECPFLGICLKDKQVPEKNSLFVYRNSHNAFVENRKDNHSPKHALYDLINEGMVKALEIPRSWLTPKQQVQYDVIDTKKPHIETEMIKAGIKTLKYPLYYLDFESFASPLPRYKGEKPYQQSLFQFSLHIEHENQPMDKDDNYYYLADDHSDHREKLVKALIEYIPMDEGHVIVYNKGFESGRIKELIQLFPEHAKHLEHIKRRIFDLLYLVRGNDDFYEMLGFDKEKRNTLVYYDGAFQRSYSIKQVLPVFAPEMNYKMLDEVQNGQQAQITYYLMQHQNANQKTRSYSNMLEYCKLDTWAMVEINRQDKSIKIEICTSQVQLYTFDTREKKIMSIIKNVTVLDQSRLRLDQSAEPGDIIDLSLINQVDTTLINQKIDEAKDQEYQRRIRDIRASFSSEKENAIAASNQRSE
jgi:hypothetical protein